MNDHPGSELKNDAEVLRRVVPLAKAFWDRPSAEAFMPPVDPPPAPPIDPPTVPSDPSKSAFMPGSNDKGGLSTHAQVVSAEDAYRAYLSPTRRALGTWGISVDECKKQSAPPYSDGGIEGNPANHVSVWFPMPAPRRVHERIALELCKAAIARKCLYRPADPTSGPTEIAS